MLPLKGRLMRSVAQAPLVLSPARYCGPYPAVSFSCGRLSGVTLAPHTGRGRHAACWG